MNKQKLLKLLVAFVLLFPATEVWADGSGRLTDYVDPKIGSEGLGRVFIGPSMPFGMVKPSPDCTVSPNSAWLPMPVQVNGFAQVHVSGTGGGPKYGNILIMPFCGPLVGNQHIAHRKWENVSLGYYATELDENNIGVEITTAERASFYRIAYPADSLKNLLIDPGFFLGENPVPDSREAQQFVGSQIEIVSDHAVQGYSRIRGGWNNGPAYTVYFHLLSDQPFVKTATFRGDMQSDAKAQVDKGTKTAAIVQFPTSADSVNVVVGISFISEMKAKENAETASKGKTFDIVHADLLNAWEKLFQRVKIAENTPEAYKRMFYTGLYHTMIMPVDRTGENPKWTDAGVPYYDDYYAIWDTYRSSTPLITLIDPKREADIVNSLINICKRDGYMPDARSGNANGRTQGGSNAEIVLADAFVKGLEGINYEAALEAMLKDATVDPGARHEAEGRGGLNEYLSLGYVPHGIDRAGNRTVEYSYCDYTIGEVAKGLGKEKLAEQYFKQASNWKNLWRNDYEHLGSKGFIMPRDAEGQWLDSIQFGHSETQKPTYVYTPVTFEGPWYTPWWSMFFYEASAWEYSLSIPHDVDGLIEASGGPEAFAKRLTTFFDLNLYNVNNEPSFLSPCLYHWLGRPDKSSDAVRKIIAENFSDGTWGLPGNDDSGAMSSWLAFHMMGLYPNAGQDYYLIHSPLLESSTFHLDNGKDFTIRAENFLDGNPYIISAKLNGQDYPYSAIRHSDIMKGGELVLTMGDMPGLWGHQLGDADKVRYVGDEAFVAYQPEQPSDSVPENLAASSHLTYIYKLHGQTRRYKMAFVPQNGGVRVDWGIERNTKWQSGSYFISEKALERGDKLSFRQPVDGENIALDDNTTFAMVSRRALRELKKQGKTVINGVVYQRVPTDIDGMVKAVDAAEGGEIHILDGAFPMVMTMQNNPLEINWTTTIAEP